MGQTGSSGGQAQAHAHAARRAHTLPHEPLRHAPKVLPSLTESPRLRSTDNGAILQSGGTISGRRPVSHLETRHTGNGHVHNGVYRSRSAGAASESSELRARERDPLHRSHTNLDIRHNDNNNLSRFGSEPDLRVEEDPPKPRCTNKHFRKKYRAPPPPANNVREGSSPDSSEGNTKTEPQRKLRLFKTRTETKKLNGPITDSKIPVSCRNSYQEYKSLDLNDNNVSDRRYKSTYRDREQHLKYPDNKDMVQTSTSLIREEHIMQTSRYDCKKTRDKLGGCRAKASKVIEQNESWKTPLLNKNFRHSDRFRREDSEQPILRREKSFDATLIAHERNVESPKSIHASRMKAIGEQLKANRLSPLATNDKALRKSLPSLITKSNEEKDEFQAELKRATHKIRKEIGSKVNLVSENKTSQKDSRLTNAQKPNPTKTTANKVKESSLTMNNINVVKQESSATKIANSRRALTRTNDYKPKAPQHNNINKKSTTTNKDKFSSKVDSRGLTDRGQASGKESTPEHSPTRNNDKTMDHLIKETHKSAPSKQFYFGMTESKHVTAKDNLKDFPGLGSPIIEEINNFHLIEKKLLGYHEEDELFDKFNAALKEDTKVKNLSSESALSSDAEGSVSDSSLGIALRLRPTLPKKQPAVPRFSPAAAWKQLASLDAQLAAESLPLAVETKVCGAPAAEVSPRSDQSADQSADKSGDSGISGDHAHSDPRIDSPSRQHGGGGGADTWTPQQDLGDSSSDGAPPLPHPHPAPNTYSARGQPFSLSLPRDAHDKGKQLQQGFNSLQKLKKSVSGALGAALGSRRFDIEHEPMLQEPEQNWFLTKSAPNSLSNPLLFQHSRTKVTAGDDIKEEVTPPSSDKEEVPCWRGASYLSWGGHVMYLPPTPADQPLSLMGHIDRPTRSKSSGELEMSARAARAAREARSGALAGEMRERERSASPGVARALPARVEPATNAKSSNNRPRAKRFTFQSTVRQLERRRLAEKLSKEADLKELQRRTELEAMRRVEEEFQRKRAREKANIRQQLRLVSGATSLPPITTSANVSTTQHKQSRDSPDGSACRESPSAERGSRGVREAREARDGRQRHSNTSSEISARSKSSTPVRCVELSEWRQSESGARVYRDWGPVAATAHDHPPATAHMPRTTHYYNNGGECSAFSGSPRSDNYRLEFARGVARSPRTPRPPRLLAVPPSPSTSGSDLSHRQPIKIREGVKDVAEPEEPAIVPTLRPAGPARAALLTH